MCTLVCEIWKTLNFGPNAPKILVKKNTLCRNIRCGQPRMKILDNEFVESLHFWHIVNIANEFLLHIITYNLTLFKCQIFQTWLQLLMTTTQHSLFISWIDISRNKKEKF